MNNLTNQQFNKLVQEIKDKKIRIDSFKGTVLTDLLAYSNQLMSNGSTSQAHTANYLKTLLSQENSPLKDHQNPQNNSLLISGLIMIGVLVLGVSYYLGQKRNQKDKKDC